MDSGEKLRLEQCLDAFGTKLKERVMQRLEESWTGWDDPTVPNQNISALAMQNFHEEDWIGAAGYVMFLWYREQTGMNAQCNV